MQPYLARLGSVCLHPYLTQAKGNNFMACIYVVAQGNYFVAIKDIGLVASSIPLKLKRLTWCQGSRGAHWLSNSTKF